MSDGDFRLSNSISPLYITNYTELSDDVVIKGCKRGEVITIKGNTKQIATNLATHNIANNFNYIYPHLINLDGIYPEGAAKPKSVSMLRKNIFTLSGCSANINMAYRTVRFAVI